MTSSDLPIANHRDELIRLIQDRQTVIVCGATGSGKSTQIPKFCLEAGRGLHGRIGHTQPRRLAASSIARRLAEELDSPLGELVGYKIRFHDRTRPSTRIQVMTDGILLTEIQADRNLRAYDTIIIDEVHERSLNIDLLLSYLRLLLDRRPELRLILTSATIEANRFADHFSDLFGAAPIVEVEGRTFPVEIRYLESMNTNELAGEQRADQERMQAAIGELLLAGSGDILVFLPTERHIRDAAKYLQGWLKQVALSSDLELLPLYARLTEAEQHRIFQPHARRRIVLATNVAESSLTVPGIRYVVDSGTARVSRYAPRSRVQRLPIEAISQASADQRAGRCGRLGPGICIRLYTESDYLSRPAYNVPEIKRTNLARAILQTKSLGVGDLADLPLLEPPRPEAIRDGMATLRELGAIDETGSLTNVGRQLARWPVDPRIGKMILEASAHHVLSDVLIIASALEVQDPRLRPPEHREAADDCHQQFCHEQSDFLSYLLVWDFYHRLKEDLGRSRLERACQQNFLSLARLREWADVHRQLVELVQRQGMKLDRRKWRANTLQDAEVLDQLDEASAYVWIHQSLLSGLLSGVAFLEDGRKYKGPNGMELELWPGSSLRRRPPKWIVAAELVETERRFARTVARIEPEWIEACAGNLLKYTFEQPHFSAKNGCAMVARKASLFGLLLGIRSLVPLAPLDPMLARRLLIDEGLIEGKLKTQASFVQANRKLIEDCRILAHRTRQREMVIDPFRLQRFYDANIPPEVVDRRTLEAWDRTLKSIVDTPKSGQKEQPTTRIRYCPFLSEKDLLPDEGRERVDELFPGSLQVGSERFPVVYQFAPGSDEDGLTLVVREKQIAKLHLHRLEWLVPGRLEELAEWMLRSAKKDLRREFMPIAETARRLAEAWLAESNFDRPFVPDFCRKLTELTGRKVMASDFELESVPEHLRFRLELRDDRGKIIRSGRDWKRVLFGDAKPSNRADAAVDLTRILQKEPWYRSKMTEFDIDYLPSKLVGHPHLPGAWFIILRDHGDYVSTELIESAKEAWVERMRGMLRLFLLVERRELKSQIQYLPQFETSLLQLNSLIEGNRLRNELAALMARLAFLEGKPEILDRKSYESRRSNRIADISVAAQEMAKWLPRLAQAYHEMKLVLQQSPKSWQPSMDAIQTQIADLFHATWFLSVPWEQLKEYPRYMQAIQARLLRMKTSGLDKDLSLEKQIQNFQIKYNDLERKAATGEACRRLLDFRWMIEEYRVSLFAQHLGTKFPVSDKRLQKSLEEIEKQLEHLQE